MFGWGSTGSRASTGVFGFLNDWVNYATHPFQKGIAAGLETIFSSVLEAVKANPYKALITIALGGVTVYFYRNSGYVEKLGEWHLRFHQESLDPLYNLRSIDVRGANSRLRTLENKFTQLQDSHDELNKLNEEFKKHRRENAGQILHIFNLISELKHRIEPRRGQESLPSHDDNHHAPGQGIKNG